MMWLQEQCLSAVCKPFRSQRSAGRLQRCSPSFPLHHLIEALPHSSIVGLHAKEFQERRRVVSDT